MKRLGEVEDSLGKPTALLTHHTSIHAIHGPMHSIGICTWRIHGSVEDTELSTNKQHSLSI